MPDNDLQPLPPIDLQRVAAEWGQSLDELHAAIVAEVSRRPNTGRTPATSGQIPARRRPKPRVYGWCDW